jgi:hypothetical protein
LRLVRRGGRKEKKEITRAKPAFRRQAAKPQRNPLCAFASLREKNTYSSAVAEENRKTPIAGHINFYTFGLLVLFL